MGTRQHRNAYCDLRPGGGNPPRSEPADGCGGRRYWKRSIPRSQFRPAMPLPRPRRMIRASHFSLAALIWRRRHYESARAHFKFAADQGDAGGQNGLGLLYATGLGGLPKDDREAVRLYKLAADQGHANGQVNLGLFYATGRGGLAKDDREAARLYKLAADQGNANGQVNLGLFYETGRGGLAKDDREAARLYKLAADQGNANGQVNLGFFYETGRGGLPQDEREALRLYKLAADQGSTARGTALLQARLRPGRRRRAIQSRGLRIRPGHDGRRRRASTSWLQTRDTHARRTSLALFYETGRGGLPKDDPEAARLYKLAADQGDAARRSSLGFFYANGRGGLAEGRPRGGAPLQARRRPGKRRRAGTISGSSTRTAVAAWRRTTARPRASTSSPQTRETQAGRPISGSSTETAVAAWPKDDREAARLYKLAADQGNAGGANKSRATCTGMAVAAWRRTTARRRGSTSSPQTRETQMGSANLGLFYGTAVAAWRRTTARRRASTSSPQTREMQSRRPISGSSTRPAVAAWPKDDREAARLYKLAADQGNAGRAGQSRQHLQGWPWRPAEGRPRGGAPLQARRRPGKRRRAGQVSGSSMRPAVVAWRRTTARRRTSTSSPQTRETQTDRPISGSSTANGRGGLAKDDREAARLYKLAADQGDAGGQVNLGFFYETGRGGLSKDNREAVRLYKLAADQGNEYAQAALKRLEEIGARSPPPARRSNSVR